MTQEQEIVTTTAGVMVHTQKSEKRGRAKSRLVDEEAKQVRKEVMNPLMQKKRGEVCEYAFQRLKHPKGGKVTQDSLMKALNDFEIKIGGGKDIDFEREVLEEMLKMAEEEGAGIGKDGFGRVFDKMKFRIDHDGRVQ